MQHEPTNNKKLNGNNMIALYMHVRRNNNEINISVVSMNASKQNAACTFCCWRWIWWCCCSDAVVPVWVFVQCWAIYTHILRLYCYRIALTMFGSMFLFAAHIGSNDIKNSPNVRVWYLISLRTISTNTKPTTERTTESYEKFTFHLL